MLITVNVTYVPIDFSSLRSNRFYSKKNNSAKTISIRRDRIQYDAMFTLQLGCLVSMTCKQRGLDKGLGFCGGFKGGTNVLPKGGGNRGRI